MIACDAVIFDMDGIIIDSEENWERARLAVVAEFGGTYHAGVAGDVVLTRIAELTPAVIEGMH